jgi:carbamoyl-phosphate synthase/aspartate carbamoyltransferase
VQVLGTPVESIIWTEDRAIFKEKILEAGSFVAFSFAVTNTTDALDAGKKVGYPVLVRAAFALGGLGSGFAKDEAELRELAEKAFASGTPQLLVEKSLRGWKEVEFEVVRDKRDNCITVCNMENFDPVGVHTGESIVVAPSQTLNNAELMMLRSASIRIIRSLKIVGECNIQYALNPESMEYIVIEVNPRLTRSSALASKATGYPLAFVAAKLSLGIDLDEIVNSVTSNTTAFFEPALDYVVVKIPRWDLLKFERADRRIGSAMKSVGEVMGIGRTLPEAFQKAMRMTGRTKHGFRPTRLSEGKPNEAKLAEELAVPTDARIFAIARAMYSGLSVDWVASHSRVDKWFLYQLERVVKWAQWLDTVTLNLVTRESMLALKQLGFSDGQIADHLQTSEKAVRFARQGFGVYPRVKVIDTLAAEYPAVTNYLYMSYLGVESDVGPSDKGIMVLGSGVYRIGNSVEFDYCTVMTARTMREEGYRTIIVNFNPETVSTDYDESDKLYFEEISLERVLDIYELEGALGIVASMGGQTPQNLVVPLHENGVRILGTHPDQIDNAENRQKFSALLDRVGVDQPVRALTRIR